MKTHAALLAASVLFLAVPAFAQRPEERRPNEQREEEKRDHEHGPNAPRANHGRIPDPPGAANHAPLLPNSDKRYHLDHPFEHGHFEHFGASYRYKVERFDRDDYIFWFPGGFSFQIASWDWDVAADWCWDCDSDDFAVYQDPDHDGWYLLYNIHTGQYVHVMYMECDARTSKQPHRERLYAAKVSGFPARLCCRRPFSALLRWKTRRG